MGRYAITDSPVEKARKAGPTGNGNWAGYDSVYTAISKACEKMAEDRYVWLSDIHVATMADLGSGHGERMKNRLCWLIVNGYVEQQG